MNEPNKLKWKIEISKMPKNFDETKTENQHTEKNDNNT